ncbi:hypothetical protein [Dactylosporangium sp. NPDC051484]|uniref:hypothetical protein n=1 Tax=Dactylosporangium sp. NPDC051484 TaxID=3154942 RepID=UPI00344E87A2
MQLRNASLSAFAVLGLAGGLLVGGAADAVPAALPACVVAPPKISSFSAADRALLPDQHLAFEQWITGDAGQKANAAVQDTIAKSVPELANNNDGKGPVSDTELSLRRGIIGSAYDHNSHSIVVVADGKVADTAALGAKARSASAGLAAGVQVDVRQGCSSAADLLDALGVIKRRDWHPQAKSASFVSYLDAATSTFQISFDAADKAVAESLRARLGSRVTVTLGGAGRTDRFNDGRPHFGGSAIGVGANDNICTSGFTVRRNSDGMRGETTAGHCFNNGDAIYSGSKFHGTATGEYDYPNYDMTLVLSNSETWSPIIHVDPCCPDTRTQTGAANPSVGTTGVCISGMVSLSRCGITISSLDGNLCDQDGCTSGLIIGARADNGIIDQPGDSGAPVYTRPGSSTATARGGGIGQKNNGTIMCAERISNITAHLGVTVLT